LAAKLQATTSGTRPRPNSGTRRDDEAERTENDSAGKEHVLPKEHERPASKNEQQESAHGRNAPDDRDNDNGCI
jgi:hypothetical protein